MLHPKFLPKALPRKALAILLPLFLAAAPVQAQRFLSEYDSTLFLRDTLVQVVSRFENLHISGYMQAQYQVAQSEGTHTYEGGNFAEHSDNRFQIRRARIRFDYQLPTKEKRPLPLAVFTFQFDANERAFTVRDMFVRIYEPSRQNFSFVLGMMGRPFGYEVNLSSQYRESPERARASQILMPSERDLGGMITFDPVKRKSGRPQLKWDIGLFNGQGIAATTDFDSYKDLISRLTLKPWKLAPHFAVSGGLSLLYGGWRQDTKYRWDVDKAVGRFVVDSSAGNEGSKAPRHYFGGDVQLSWSHGKGKTELRAEYWRGKQPGTAATTVNPFTQPEGPTYVRPFDAGIFYLLHDFNPHWELGLKYDWYDPNRFARGMQLGETGRNYTVADLRYDTWGGGVTYYVNKNLKLLAWYSHVINERTALPGLGADQRDDVFTLRTQLRF